MPNSRRKTSSWMLLAILAAVLLIWYLVNFLAVAQQAR
jgi:hypothetical protein